MIERLKEIVIENEIEMDERAKEKERERAGISDNTQYKKSNHLE